jgi:hypothetical protein
MVWILFQVYFISFFTDEPLCESGHTKDRSRMDVGGLLPSKGLSYTLSPRKIQTFYFHTCHTRKFYHNSVLPNGISFVTLQACALISVSKLLNFYLPYLVTFVNKLVFWFFPKMPRITSSYKIFGKK